MGNLGYRIDGIAGFTHKSREEADAEIAGLRSHEDNARVINEFVDLTARDGDTEGYHFTPPVSLASAMLQHLRDMRSAMEASPFVRDHEFVGSSLLLIADSSGRTGAFWIDFAKTHQTPEGVSLTHRSPWVMGN